MDSVDESISYLEDDSAKINIPKQSLVFSKTSSKPYSELTRLQKMMLSQIKEMKSQVDEFSYKKKSSIQDICNIFLFGPTGSGKSSLVKTLFMSQIGFIDHEQMLSFHIKDLNENEGTKQYTKVYINKKKFTLKKLKKVQVIGKTTLNYIHPEINIIDTRGQILLNELETKQLELMMDGKVKPTSVVKQRNFRYSYMLWEFWRRQSELFPHDILQDKSSEETKPQCVVIVFDGSLNQVPNGQEETMFYCEIIKFIIQKGYGHPQIVLTHLDLAESKEDKDYPYLINSKIESIVNELQVPRSCVHFIENYKSCKDQISIQYYALKLLNACTQAAQNYVKKQPQQHKLDSFCQFL